MTAAGADARFSAANDRNSARVCKASSLTEMRDRADAERTRFSAEQDRVAGEAVLFKDFAAVLKCLGLGWQS